MISDIDTPLRAIAGMRPRANLDGLEESVILAIRARRQQEVVARLAITTGSVALLMGIAGAVLPSVTAPASPAAPLGMPMALAPSSLLLGAAP